MHSNYNEKVHLRRESFSYENFKIIFDKIKKHALLIAFHNYGEPFFLILILEDIHSG